MVNPEYAEYLRNKANGLPLSPGVYIMKDRHGKVIYVGKSRKLKNRVSQYFHDNDFKSRKTDTMTSLVADFEYILCDTEIEALSLENSLIKLYKPRYNIRLKDDKSYPYIKATVADEYPEFSMTRKRESDKALYFGPYTGTATVFSVISAIQKTFSLPSCRRHFPKDKGRVQNCLYRQLGCVAPCMENVSSDEYKAVFGQAVRFLQGNTKEVVTELENKMKEAAANMAYEAAAKYRDRIASIKKLSEKQKVVADPDVERDVIAWQTEEAMPSICVFYVRNGTLIESEDIVFDSGAILDDSSVITLLTDLYTKREYIPKEVEISEELGEEDRQLFETWLCEKAGYRVTVRIPKRGDARKLCDMARQNAVQKSKEKFAESEKTEKSLERLAVLAKLETVPSRIEAFDISNYGSENITAGMVVFEDAKPYKKDYRVFNISANGYQDDYASMREAFSRRIGHADTMPLPDLFLVDGGEQHLNTIMSLLEEMNVYVPVLGMVKDEHHKTRALVGPEGEISIALEQNVFRLIYDIQEEVHRFSVSRMTEKKRKTIKKSSLCAIDGIGDVKASALLKHFGGLKEIKAALPEDLARVPGITDELANRIYKYFREKKK